VGATKEGAVEKCTPCNGRGVQVRMQQIGPGMVQQFQTHCNICKGRGEKINAKYLCPDCNGEKTIQEKKILEVHIDKGV